MKHLAKIQSEFIKEAAGQNWEDLSIDAQADYLRRHPKSKKRLDATRHYEHKKQKLTEKYNKLEAQWKALWKQVGSDPTAANVPKPIRSEAIKVLNELDVTKTSISLL